MKTTWVKKGNVRKVCFKETSKRYERKRQEKGKYNKPKIIIFLQERLMGKKQRKTIHILKGKTKGKPKKKQNRKKIIISKTSLSGEQNRKKTLKLQEN